MAAWPLAAAVGSLVAGFTTAATLLALAALPLLLFFRDPERHSEAGPGVLLSPADGRVVAVVSEDNGHPLAPEARQRVSIFMSPLDVHINRMPAAGRVEETSYNRGSFRAAYSPKASDINESRSLAVQADAGYRFVVVQIAGWLCRRIVCYLEPGGAAVRGQRLGLIMFGSRVDLFLPTGAKVLVSPGQCVKAGLSVVAQQP